MSSGHSPDWLKSKNPAAPAAKREAEEGIHPVASVGQGVVVGAVWKRAKQAAALGILPKTLGLLPMLLARADEVIE